MSESFWYVIAAVVVVFLFVMGTINKDARETEIRAEYGDEAEYVIDWGDSYCTDDCSGHAAGYEYAAENDICDLEYDSGNSESFNEGVRQWVYEYC